MRLSLKPGEKYTVRNIRSEDLDLLLDYISELVNEMTFISMETVPTRDEEKKWLDNNIREVKIGNKIHWVILDDNEIVGSVEARRNKGKARHMVEIAIGLRARVRSKGLGTKVLQSLLDEIQRKWPDVGLIYLRVFDVNEHAKNLYRKIGFRPVASLPYFILHNGKYLGEEFWYWIGSPLLKDKEIPYLD